MRIPDGVDAGWSAYHHVLECRWKDHKRWPQADVMMLESPDGKRYPFYREEPQTGLRFKNWKTGMFMALDLAKELDR